MNSEGPKRGRSDNNCWFKVRLARCARARNWARASVVSARRHDTRLWRPTLHRLGCIFGASQYGGKDAATPCAISLERLASAEAGFCYGQVWSERLTRIAASTNARLDGACHPKTIPLVWLDFH